MQSEEDWGEKLSGLDVSVVGEKLGMLAKHRRGARKKCSTECSVTTNEYMSAQQNISHTLALPIQALKWSGCTG